MGRCVVMPQRNSYTRRLCILLFAFLFTAVAVAGCGGGGSTPKIDPQATGSLTISSSPSGAIVYIDGFRPEGNPVTAATVSVAAGTHTVQIMLSGYTTHSTTTTVFTGATTQISANLIVSSSEEDAFGNIMNTGYAKIGDVTFVTPSAGSPCVVTARITLDGAADFPTLAVASAKLGYILNNNRNIVHYVDMFGSGDTFSATVPAQPAGTRVSFFINVTDTLGNTSTEALPVDPTANILNQLTPGVPDMDNSPDIVPDYADILGTFVGYDNDRIYTAYDLQDQMTGGTIEPPYIMLYGIKYTNPDIETSEGLMVGKLWFNMPLAKEQGGQTVINSFFDGLGFNLSGASQMQIDNAKLTGMFVIDIGKLVAGQSS